VGHPTHLAIKAFPIFFNDPVLASGIVISELFLNMLWFPNCRNDISTKWVSQEHGSKKVNDVDASEVKDSDRVICMGTWEKNGVLHATLVSKRLTN